jgi:hypothetical protein
MSTTVLDFVILLLLAAGFLVFVSMGILYCLVHGIIALYKRKKNEKLLDLQ